MLVGRIVDIENGLVGRESQTVGQRKVVHQQMQGAVRGEAIYAMKS